MTTVSTERKAYPFHLLDEVRAQTQECLWPSHTKEGMGYRIRDLFSPWATCTCPDFTMRDKVLTGDTCKHIDAAREYFTGLWQWASIHAKHLKDMRSLTVRKDDVRSASEPVDVLD